MKSQERRHVDTDPPASVSGDLRRALLEKAVGDRDLGLAHVPQLDCKLELLALPAGGCFRNAVRPAGRLLPCPTRWRPSFPLSLSRRRPRPSRSPASAGHRVALLLSSSAMPIADQRRPSPQRPAPPARVLSLFSSMAFSTPSVRAATLTEIAACPAAKRLAALIVDDHHRGRHACRRGVLGQHRRQRPARQGDTPLREPLRQHRPRPRQPARHRPFGTAELRGDLLAGLALQIAQDDDGPVVVRQAAQLLVQQGLQVGPLVLRQPRCRASPSPALPSPSAWRRSSGL